MLIRMLAAVATRISGSATRALGAVRTKRSRKTGASHAASGLTDW
jgi:hypothetical protein